MSAAEGEIPMRNPQSTTRNGSNHGWIWFFAVIIVLAVAAAAITWTYNVQQQLSPEELAALDELGRLLEQYQTYLIAGHAFADAARAQASNASGTARPAHQTAIQAATSESEGVAPPRKSLRDRPSSIHAA